MAYDGNSDFVATLVTVQERAQSNKVTLPPLY